MMARTAAIGTASSPVPNQAETVGADPQLGQ